MDDQFLRLPQQNPTPETRAHILRYLKSGRLKIENLKKLLDAEEPKEDAEFRKAFMASLVGTIARGHTLQKLGGNGRLLSSSPHIEYYSDALSPIACAYLIEKSRHSMVASMVMADGAGKIKSEVRQSSTRFLSNADEIEVFILDHVCAALQLKREFVEFPNITYYSIGGIFKAHFDRSQSKPEGAPTDTRKATCIVYLNEGYEGGETAFIHANIAVKGKTGDVIRFRNVTSGEELDRASLHASLPVSSGEKWVLVFWQSVIT